MVLGKSRRNIRVNRTPRTNKENELPSNRAAINASRTTSPLYNPSLLYEENLLYGGN